MTSIWDDRTEITESLADYAHDAWAGWVRYMFENCGAHLPSGQFAIERDMVERWKRLMDTPYDELTEDEKESDRAEAVRIIDLVED